MTAPVFFADGPLDALTPGAVYLLGGAEGRHAALVQRRGPGERIDVVDGTLRARCMVMDVVGEGLRLRVEEIDPEAEPDVRLVLVQALAKGGRDELAIEAATEVGADSILPWQADRSIVRWRGERAAKAHAKWVAAVRTAAKQSRRATVPGVEPLVDSAGLVVRIEDVVAGGGRAVVLHEAATESLRGVPVPAGAGVSRAAGVENEPESRPQRAEATPATTDDGFVGSAGTPEVLVVVGPEGGIEPRELAAFTAAGARVARLGPHVMRTSTAGPVAVALLAQRLGRWD